MGVGEVRGDTRTDTSEVLCLAVVGRVGGASGHALLCGGVCEGRIGGLGAVGNAVSIGSLRIPE